MDGFGGMGGMGGFGFLWSLLWLVAVVAIIAAAVYLLVTKTDLVGGGDGALDELRARYARGEIDDDEFDRRMAVLTLQ